MRQLSKGGKTPVVIMVTAAGRQALAEKPKSEADLLDGIFSQAGYCFHAFLML